MPPLIPPIVGVLAGTNGIFEALRGVWSPRRILGKPGVSKKVDSRDDDDTNLLFEGFCKTFLNFSYLSNPLAEVLKDIKIAWKESWKDDKKTRHIHGV